LPKSHCTACGKSLPWYLNIPIISYLLLNGKCKYCGAKIHIHHLWVELITPVIFIALFWRFQDNVFLFIKYSALFIFLIPIFVIDLYHRLIPDKLTIPLAVTGLAFSIYAYTDVTFKNAILTSVGILVLMLVIAWLFEKIRHKEGMGGGDIKFLAAMATFLGVLNISFVLFFASVIAIIAALTSSKTREQGIPYGPFLVLSAFLWILFGDNFLSWYLNLL